MIINFTGSILSNAKGRLREVQEITDSAEEFGIHKMMRMLLNCKNNYLQVDEVARPYQ